MSRITDPAAEQELRELEDDNPDYAGMRRRILLEVDKRRSGWKAESVSAEKRSLRRGWTMSAGAGVLACVAVAGVLFWQTDTATEPASTVTSNLNETSKAYTAPAGQALEASATVDGIKLTINNLIQGHFQGRSTTEKPSDRLVLQMSLSGLNVPNAEYAGFASTRLTDLDSGATQEWKGASFDLRQGMQNVSDAQVFDGDWAEEGQARRFRFETSDLYTVRRHDISLEGVVKDQTEYPIPSLQGASVLLTDSKWDEEQGLLTLNYKLQGTEAYSLSSLPESLFSETQTQLLLNTGTRTIAPTSGTRGDDAFSMNYELYDMSAEERQALTLTYSYAETVEKIEGSWQMDFTLDGTQAQERVVQITPENASEIEQKIGWKLGQADVSAYGVYLPIERERKDRKLHDGLVLYYEKSVLVAEGFESWQGEHAEHPSLLSSGQAAQGQEALSFRFMSEAVRNLTTGPLAIRLQNALVVREAPTGSGTVLAAPTQQEQRIDAELPDGSILHYRYSREGDVLKVITETENSLHLLEAPIVNANGDTYRADGKSSYAHYRPNGDYRVDVYPNVPQGVDPELVLGLYSQIDPSLDTEIVLRK
ncbi:hypothetical protein [Saccharibacillus endophyticus]|uniref:DUF4179 domain-containing protein n=1 Tax=Saccharibacillus endophyticus TaxID=2060666 RepID=A0ABQ1ZTJ0_9BACL|nr:hypothetical protein [Saccharibacillus endophyticus]GGH76361.1 hypothetical protein GCM10007362_18490 [Saccharibacillus endophyticus]